jgi:hypothetical protein
MTRFPTAGHLVSWAKYAPGVSESAGKKKGKNSTGHGNPYLASILGNAAAAAAKADTFLGERYRRIARRCGSRKANVGHRPLHPGDRLAPALRPDARCADLGPDFYAGRIDPDRRRRARPPTRSPRLHRHPRTRRLTAPEPDPAPLRSAGCCRAPPNCPIFGLAVGPATRSRAITLPTSVIARPRCSTMARRSAVGRSTATTATNSSPRASMASGTATVTLRPSTAATRVIARTRQILCSRATIP